MKRCLLCVLVIFAVSAALAAGALAAAGGNPNPRVVPITAKVGGLDYNQWAARWLQWLLSHSLAADLLADPAAGQDPKSEVFFLPTWWGATGPQMEGDITVPAGKKLLVPLTTGFGFWYLMTPNLPPMPSCATSPCQTTPEGYLTCIREAFALGMETVITNPYAYVDGEQIADAKQYAALSEAPFHVDLPADNPFTLGCGAGAFSTDWMIQGGYWLFLEPLSVGKHELRFGSDLGETILHVTVAPGGR